MAETGVFKVKGSFYVVCCWGQGEWVLFFLHRSVHPLDDCLCIDTSGSPAAEPVGGKMRILNVTESFALKGADRSY